MKRGVFILIVILFVIDSKGQDSSGATYSLKEAQAYAIKNNLQIKMAAIDIGISQQTVKSLTAIGLPQIDGSGSFQHFLDIPTSVVPADAFGFPGWFNQWINDISQNTGTYPNFPPIQEGEFQELQFGSKYSSSVGINMQQLIFDGSYLIGLKAANTYVEVNEQTLVKTEIEVKNLVAQAYYSVLVSYENIKIITSNINSVKKTLNEAKEIEKNGLIEETDISQIELMLTNLKISLRNAKQQENISRNLLKFQMGMDISNKIILSNLLENLIAEAKENSIVENPSSESHIDFKLAQTQVTLMSLNHKAENSKYLPTLRGFFNHQQNSFRNEFNFFDGGQWYPSTLWGLNISVPIFGGFGQNAKLQKAKLDLEKAELLKSQVEQYLKLSIQSAKAEFATAIDHFENKELNLKLSKKINENTLIKFQEGMSTTLDLSLTENQLFNSQANYIQSIFRFLKAKSNLDKAIGQL